MADHVELRKRHQESAEEETDEGLIALNQVHRTNEYWKPGGCYHGKINYRIWMLCVRLEMRKRGLL